MSELTTEQRDLFGYIDTLIPDDGHLQHDFRDPQQHEFTVVMAQLSGDADKYPGAIQTLDLMRGCHQQTGPSLRTASIAGGWVDMFTIPGLGLAEGAPTCD